jgi:hypothetical protein
MWVPPKLSGSTGRTPLCRSHGPLQTKKCRVIVLEHARTHGRVTLFLTGPLQSRRTPAWRPNTARRWRAGLEVSPQATHARTSHDVECSRDMCPRYMPGPLAEMQTHRDEIRSRLQSIRAGEESPLSGACCECFISLSMINWIAPFPRAKLHQYLRLIAAYCDLVSWCRLDKGRTACRTLLDHDLILRMNMGLVEILLLWY